MKLKFLHRGTRFNVFLTNAEVVLTKRFESIRLRLLHANPKAQVSGVGELPGKANYFIGNDARQWRTNVPTYARVKYESI